MERSMKSLWRDVRGNVLIFGAVSMPLFIGGAGLASDTIMWALWQRDSQRAADSAALAGALTVQQSFYQGEKAAVHDFKKSKAFKDLKGKIVVEHAPKSGPWAGDINAVYVRVTIQRVLPFSNFFLQKAPLITAEATAALASGVNNCVIALDGEAQSAVRFTGTSDTSLNCGVMSNSTHTQSVGAEGSSSVSAPVVSAVGGIPNSSRYSASTELNPHENPHVDPWRDLEQPKVPKPCNAAVQVDAGKNATISPGCYAGMSIAGQVTFAPGVYYITTSDFAVASKATVTGEDVTFFLLNDTSAKKTYYPQLKIDGQAEVKLSAPGSGPYESLLFFQDRLAPFSEKSVNFVAGNSYSQIRGDLYFPNQQLTFTGTSGGAFECFRMIARRITFTGTSTLTGDSCPGVNARYARKTVRLVA